MDASNPMMSDEVELSDSEFEYLADVYESDSDESELSDFHDSDLDELDENDDDDAESVVSQSLVSSDNLTTATIDVSTIVKDCLWGMISRHSPDWYVCPVFKVMLGGNREKFEEAWTPINFAPNLGSVLIGKSPPAIDFFKTLTDPTNTTENVWGVYALVLEKKGETPKLYIGSRTNESRGLARRFRHYVGNRQGHRSCRGLWT
ncbi:hypothetical protein B0T20DRAFT_67165 [Sordaria brevicollis]|uniref:GIY-YIG domain-containing protein n=1 Tax=Sordaria brevicollis TaxID=83679 RepID=A0AAE0P234_SORBR|nr:hypothetical protein B0T20DRAFT_67165 [Sordaria brevicollis]